MAKDTLAIEYIGEENRLLDYGFHYDSIYDRYVISLNRRLSDIVVKKNANKRYTFQVVHGNNNTYKIICDMFKENLIRFVLKEELYHG